MKRVRQCIKNSIHNDAHMSKQQQNLMAWQLKILMWKLIANYYRSQVQNSSRRSVHEAGMMPTAGHNRPEGEGIEVVIQGDGEGSVNERAAVPTAGHTRPGRGGNRGGYSGR